jgi:AcrR family transcriptional regulator
MPKAFTEREKEQIRAQLRTKGRALFEKSGIKKTSVDELAQAVGISKGAFYIFYESKEELLMEILEGIEADIRGSILNYVINKDKDAKANVTNILKNMLLTWDQYPLLKSFGKSEFEYLVRKIPAERAHAHAQSDEEFAKNFMKKLKSENIKPQANARTIASLIKSLFFVGLHRNDMGDDAYQESIGILIELVAGYITEE